MKHQKPVCIILAAGASSRFGGDKLAARLNGKSLLRHAVEAIPAGEFAQVLLVTARDEGKALAAEFGFTLVENAAPEKGISHTIRLGLNAAPPCSGALFLVADQPSLRPETVALLLRTFASQPDRIVCAAHEGKRGNPCLFPSVFFSELRALTGDAGGSTVIQRHPEAVLLVEVPAAELLDVDTPDELKKLVSACTQR